MEIVYFHLDVGDAFLRHSVVLPLSSGSWGYCLSPVEMGNVQIPKW